MVLVLVKKQSILRL